LKTTRLVYNYLKVAVRHGLGQHGVMPSLDFEQELSLQLPYITNKMDQDKPIVTPARNSAAWQTDEPKQFNYGGDRKDNQL